MAKHPEPLTPRIREEDVDRLLGAAFRARVGEDTPADDPDHVDVASRSLGGGGRYEVLGELGRGGVGTVFRALDRRLGRELAVKVLSDREPVDELARVRFLNEARICSQLEHPGIVPVHDVEEESAPLMTMRLVDGTTFAELLEARADPGEDRLRSLSILLHVCHAVAFAHARGFVHRDLKPSNVMVGGFGEVQVVDWGLAKRVNSPLTDSLQEQDASRTVFTADRPRTLVGTVSGTPAYMSPEQARGEPSAIHPRSDVFSLGAILCDVLTGAPPFIGGSPAELRNRAAHAQLDDARQRLDESGADPSLVALALRCLAPDREERPRNAGELAAQLEAFLDATQRRAEEARLEAAAFEARARSERRARWATAAALATVVGATALGAWILRSQERAHDQRVAATRAEVDVALEEAAALRASPTLAARQRALGAIERAESVLSGGQGDPALEERVALARVAATADLRSARQEEARDLREIDLLRALLDVRDEVASSMSLRRMHEGYSEAFAAFGVDLASEDEAVNALRAVESRAELLDALDHWALFSAGPDEREERKLLRQRAIRIADALDESEVRRCIRRAAANRRVDELTELATSFDPGSETWSASWMLGSTYLGGGDDAAAARAWMAGVRAYPDSFWLRFALGFHAERLGIEDGASQLTACVALRPDSGAAWTSLGVQLARTSGAPGARHAFENALRFSPHIDAVHLNLWICLSDLDEHEGALAAAERWCVARPGDTRALFSRAESLRHLGRTDEARRAYVSALERTRELEDLEGPTRSILETRARVERALRDPEAARETLTRMVDSNADDYWALHELGHVELDDQRWSHAEQAFARALEVRPDDPEALTDLGLSRFWGGRPRDALEPLRRAQALGTKRPTGQYLAVVEEHVRVSDIVEGRLQPADVAEMLKVGRFLAEDVEDLVSAARFYAMAFEADLNESGGSQYFAACYAVRAAAGEGVGSETLTESERRGLRDRAYSWLRRFLDDVTPVALAGNLGTTWQDHLDEWRTAPALATVRDESELRAYDEEERDRWRGFWSDLEALLEKLGR